MKKFFAPNTLLCFSPAIMVATIIIELSLALWVFTRYATRTSRRLILLLLVFLAAFQLAEFNVCGSAIPDLIWSRVGYIFITMLPPLGLHLIVRLRRDHRPKLVGTAYLAAAAFALAFGFLPSGLNQGVCTGNYVIFLLAPTLSMIYGIYYLGFVFLGLLMALVRPAHTTGKQRTALSWTAIGYIAFTLPVLIIDLILPYIHLGIPSIMCGFAVILAIILGIKVAPLAED